MHSLEINNIPANMLGLNYRICSDGSLGGIESNLFQLRTFATFSDFWSYSSLTGIGKNYLFKQLKLIDRLCDIDLKDAGSYY